MRPSRLLTAIAVGSLLLGVPAVGNAAPAVAAAQQEDPSAAAERDMKRQSSGKVTVTRDERGIARFVGTEPGKPVRRPEQAAANASAEKKAAAHVKRYGALWGLHKKGSDARISRTHPGSAGQGKGSVVRFQQTVDGTPVLGGELAVALDDAGNLQSVSGETTPLAPDSADLKVSASTAKQTAVRVAARMNEVSAETLRASEPEAFLYDPALLGSPGRPQLAQVWEVEVTGAPEVRHLVLVDRTRGNVALQFNQIAHAVDRVVCDNNNIRQPDTDCKATNANKARAGNEPSTGIAEVDAAYDYLGDSAKFFADEVGVDLQNVIGSNAGDGNKLRATVRFCLPDAFDPQCPMQNAFWNGSGVYLGSGTATADDIVAHELTHGVVEKTANLLYWYQSGAINESMADVFGELIDLTNGNAESPQPWKLGEDSSFGVLRNMANPPIFGDPDRMKSPHYRAAPWTSGEWDNGGVHRNSGVGNKAAYLIARPAEEGAVSFNGRSITGIGYSKAAKVYYQALKMLTSGADYQDLFGVLPQACSNLVAGGVGGLTSADCATVSAAVTATEMNQQPSKGQAPEAPVCDSGTKQNMLLDGFGSTSNWAWTSGLWARIDFYARSGKYSFYGVEPDRTAGQPAASYARIPKAYKIPSGVKTYLRFDHQYLLLHNPDSAAYYAGAALLYSADGGKSFRSASNLPWSNGPNRTITPWNAAKQQYDPSYRGFGGDSHGYQSSRLDVSSLAGKSVIFRWRITADPDFALDGWTLDDVNIYTCGQATPSEPNSIVTIGGLNQATVRWTAPVWKGSGLTKYRITVMKGGSVVKAYNVGPSATSTVVRGLAGGTTYRFYVRPFTAVGHGPVVSKLLIGSAHKSSLYPTTIYKGKSTKFSGKVYRTDTGAGMKGATIVLQGRRYGTSTWSNITSARSGTGGSYSFTRWPSRSWQYRVLYRSGSGSYMGSASAIRTVTVR